MKKKYFMIIFIAMSGILTAVVLFFINGNGSLSALNDNYNFRREWKKAEEIYQEIEDAHLWETENAYTRGILCDPYFEEIDAFTSDYARENTSEYDKGFEEKEKKILELVRVDLMEYLCQCRDMDDEEYNNGGRAKLQKQMSRCEKAYRSI